VHRIGAYPGLLYIVEYVAMFHHERFKSLLHERALLLERDGDKSLALIPQVNALNAKIWLTKSIKKIALSAQATPMQFKRNLE
jgi:hypothetical protein